LPRQFVGASFLATDDARMLQANDTNAWSLWRSRARGHALHLVKGGTPRAADHKQGHHVKHLIAALLLFAGVANAQTDPTLTFTAEFTRGVETVVPKLTWTTSPAATSCTASGDWSGTKAASGTETLDAVNVTKAYTLVCTWPGDSKATLTWVAPTTYTNGQPMTVAKYRITFGTSLTDVLTGATGTQTRDHNFPTSTSATVTGINTPGTYHFCLRAVDAAGTASDCGKKLDDLSYPSKVITGSTTQTRSVSIAVDPKPSAPSGVEAQ
jgi:hypothetical protein